MPTPGSSLERAKPATLPAGASPAELDFGEMLRRANVLAKTELVPKALRGKPEAIVLVGAYGAELGVPFTTSLQQIDVIEGRPNPSAQLRVALIRRAGHEVRWGETSSERAVIRGRRREDARDPDAWSEVVWTIEDARRAGLVDRWVERRVADGKWPDGNTKWKTEKVVVGDDRGLFTPEDRIARGLPRELPEWASKELNAGELKAKDNWQRYPADMLRARAATSLSRMQFSDVLAALGLDPAVVEHVFDSDLDTDGERPAGRPEPDDDDDGIDDAELVDEPELRSEQEPEACPLPGCTVAGPHDHDSWVEQKTPADDTPPPAETEEKPDPRSWDGDKWREVLAASGIKLVSALKEARSIATEAGLVLPGSLDELEGTDVAPALAARLEALR